MDADYDILEIVTIVRDFWLIDAESYQRRYSTKHRQPLTPGYYVVNWPEHIRARRFNEDATFHGPFKLRDEARAALGKMHEERECVFTMLPERELAAVPKASQIAVKKAA
ncbi:MAG: hypothetical protein ACXWT3_12250 [Methylococcaceae bacterium]